MLALVRSRAFAFVRAASTAAPERVPLYKKITTTDEKLANVGVKWSEEEVQSLVTRVDANEPLESIALQHKRTLNSIKAKLTTLASSAIDADPSSQARVLAKYHVTTTDIEELKQRNAARREAARKAARAPSARSSAANPAAANPAAAKPAAAAPAADPNAPPRPANVGKPWTAEHNEELMKQAAARKPIADISALLARTPKSIEMRIAQLSFDKGMTKVHTLLPPLPPSSVTPFAQAEVMKQYVPPPP